MEINNEITASCPLLASNGHISEEGWARYPFWKYDKNKIKAPWFRIKEWDYYYILSKDLKRGITLTMSDMGYAGLIALCWLDFENNTSTQIDTLSILPRGRIFQGKQGIPVTPDSGIFSFSNSKLSLQLESQNGIRKLSFSAPGFETTRGEKGLSGEIILHQAQDLESMNIATSWKENRKRFYYNRKINCMPAEGSVTIGNSNYIFDPQKDSGALDWGRGAWPYKNRWYWGSASGMLNGESFGFNLGYGFSDRTPASENVLFYKGKAHKLAEIEFEMNTANYLEPWKITSSDGRFQMDFQPQLDRYSSVNLVLIRSVQHQIFGHFSGAAILDDGTKIVLDKFQGFAEDVLNYW